MSWLRIDDALPNAANWDGVPHEARWMFLAMVADASRSERWDGVMSLNAALGIGLLVGVDDGKAALGHLAAHGWLSVGDDTVTIFDCEFNYMPPPHLRDNTRKAQGRKNQQAYRARKCEAGEHSKDCPAGCPKRAPQLADVSTPPKKRNQSRNQLRQDRTGQDALREGSPENETEEFCPICGGLEVESGCSPMKCQGLTG